MRVTDVPFTSKKKPPVVRSGAIPDREEPGSFCPFLVYGKDMFVLTDVPHATWASAAREAYQFADVLRASRTPTTTLWNFWSAGWRNYRRPRRKRR